MSALPKTKIYTPEEYLALEREAEEMSAFHDGKIVPRASSNIDHARIMSNVSRELGLIVRPERIQVLPVGLKVRTLDSKYFLYPDILVLHSKPISHDSEEDVILNPYLVIEIYTKETSRFDRNDKFVIYQSFKNCFCQSISTFG